MNNTFDSRVRHASSSSIYRIREYVGGLAEREKEGKNEEEEENGEG